MRMKTVNILLFLGVVSTIMAVAMFTQKAAAQQPPGCTIDPATGAQVCPPPANQPPDTKEPRKPRPTRTPTFVPVRIPSRTPTPTEIATLSPVCGLPGLPNCGSTAVLSIVCSANLIVSASSSSGANVVYSDPVVNSTCKGSAPKVVCSLPSGALFPLGSNMVTCTVTDSCGLAAICSFFVNVNPYRPLPTSTTTPTPVAAAPGSPGEAGAAGQNFIPPVLLLPAVKNGIIGVLIIVIIIIGGLGLRRFFGKRELPSSPSDQFVKLTRLPGDGGSDQFHKTDGSSQFIKGDGSNQFFKFKTPSDGVNLGGGIESATMTIHDIHFDPQDKINSFDANGFNSNGFNANGFDQNGFNSNGFDANGFDQNGFNNNGFNANGFDQNGFNSNGFDANGLDANGLDSNGFKGGEWIGHQ
jgi:hypothetical protein